MKPAKPFGEAGEGAEGRGPSDLTRILAMAGLGGREGGGGEGKGCDGGGGGDFGGYAWVTQFVPPPYRYVVGGFGRRSPHPCIHPRPSINKLPEPGGVQTFLQKNY